MDPVSEDPPVSGGNLFHLVVGDPPILGMLMVPPGEGPFPLVVLSHGFPGHDDNMDIAHMLLRGGFAVATYHYRGSWGSGGNFSFSGMVQSLKEVLSHLRENSSQYGIDPKIVTLIGYSMGGWASLVVAEGDDSIKNVGYIAGYNLGLISGFAELSSLNRDQIVTAFKEYMPPLKGCTPEGLLKEIMSHSEEFDILSRAGSFMDRSILMVKAKNDRTAIPDVHHGILLEAFKEAGIKDLTEVTLDTGHQFLGKRIALKRAIWVWLKNRIN
jgi:pimeloyl-ACP methyl ester carboxylesterase